MTRSAHRCESGVTRSGANGNHGGKAARGATGGGGDERVATSPRGEDGRATRSGAQKSKRGEASGDDLKRAPVAPARGRGCRGRCGGKEAAAKKVAKRAVRARC